jgi:MFS family permease
MFYAMYGIGSLFASPIMRRIGPQKCMIVGSVLDCVWILSSLLPVTVMKMRENKVESMEEHFYTSDGFVYFITLFASMMGGLGESI